ncbi:small GTP-binding protein [Trypanosoma rangeli]|uniref:Ras-related protein Rab n=1 Tax=Trypanosoma rangeli TaxID=5698 RepID=A0A3R7ME44_TRYRA|nr:small GTP-binding protein [Trypanosoma rangeli]RNF00873.1 small GTP-binding protein [Trypanosoma rangeli]|eukprot:RNF00873.1 small GTP-binding protein [Trypanosoma rangeli]
MAYVRNSELLFKVLVVGESGTGKTCLIRRYVHSIFLATNKATIGVDFALKDIVHAASNRNITLQLWDIAGQERYGQMTRVYYQAAAGAVVVADITRPETLDLAVKWKLDLDSKVSLRASGKPIPCILLINKLDLLPNGVLAAAAAGDSGSHRAFASEGGIQKTKEEMDEFCRSHGFEAWFVTSAKENKNVDAAFHKLVDCVLNSVDALGGGAVDIEAVNDKGASGKVLHSNRARRVEKSSCAC